MKTILKPVHYVVGIAFAPTTSIPITMLGTGIRTAHLPILLKSQGPENVRNRWNFPGGQVLPREGPQMAIAREYQEETGVDVDPKDWDLMLTKHFPNGVRLDFLVTELTKDEILDMRNVSDLGEPISKEIVTVSNKGAEFYFGWENSSKPKAHDLLPMATMAWHYLVFPEERAQKIEAFNF